MTDAEFVLRQDIREKKSVGRGIFAKKNGSRSKKCTFPSDYMTKREKERMNSTVATYDLKKFYSWEAFKAMPVSIQVDYLNRLIDIYRITLSNIAEEQFSINKTTVRQHAEHYGYLKQLHLAGKGHRASKDDLDRYLTDILNATEGSPAASNEKEEPAIEETPKEIASVPNSQTDMPLSSAALQQASITMAGFDFDTFSWLSNKYAGQSVRVTIMVDI